jgi:hypothetical protein
MIKTLKFLKINNLQEHTIFSEDVVGCISLE